MPTQTVPLLETPCVDWATTRHTSIDLGPKLGFIHFTRSTIPTGRVHGQTIHRFFAVSALSRSDHHYRLNTTNSINSYYSRTAGVSHCLKIIILNSTYFLVKTSIESMGQSTSMTCPPRYVDCPSNVCHVDPSGRYTLLFFSPGYRTGAQRYLSPYMY